MKQIKKIILTIIIALIACVSLTGCEKANTYRKFYNNESLLPKDHILDEVSYKELKKLIVANEGSEEYIYVFIGTPSNSDAQTKAVVFNEQARQYGVETLYWLDTELSDKRLETLKLDLQMNSFDKNQAYLLSYQDGKIKFDSSSASCSRKDGDESGAKLSNTILAANCFQNKTERK